MEDINETYKVLGKITFCRKLVWTFGNDEEERSPEVLKAHWWNTMKKVFDEHGAYCVVPENYGTCVQKAPQSSVDKYPQSTFDQHLINIFIDT